MIYGLSTTDYPEAVIAHMRDGKSPLIAWRLYRHLCIAEVAARYGTTPSNINTLAQSHTLQFKTRKKLAAVLDCQPAQLLRPDALFVRSTSI